MMKITIGLNGEKPTEIRHEEESRGGLRYEIIIAEPLVSVASPKRPAVPIRNVSFEEIELKLKAAEERRLSLKQKRMSEIKNMLAKTEWAARKKDTICTVFSARAKERLDEKLKQYVANQQIIMGIKIAKLMIHAKGVKKARERVELEKNLELSIEDESNAERKPEPNIRMCLKLLKKYQRTTTDTATDDSLYYIVDNGEKVHVDGQMKLRELTLKKKLGDKRLYARLTDQTNTVSVQTDGENTDESMPSSNKY